MTAAQALLRIDTSRRWLWFAVFVPLMLLYLWTLRTNPSAINVDAPSVVPSAIGIARHGTPIVPVSFWGPGNPCAMLLGHGTAISDRTPGLIYLAVPVYWLFGARDPSYELPASAEAALITAAAMGTLALVFARFVSHRTALLGALVAGTATTTWTVSGVALWPHGPDQLVIALALCGLAADRFARAGLAFGLGLLIRPLLGFPAAVAGLVASWKARSIRPALAIAVPAGCCLAFYAWYAHHYWTGGPSGDKQAFLTATHGYGGPLTELGLSAWLALAVKLAGFLVSPGRGILIGSSFLLALLPGLRRAWRVAPTWVRSSAAGAVIYMLIQLKGEVFTGGYDFWGYRYPIEMLTLCAPLLLLCWREWTTRTARRRAAFGALVIVSISWQAVGAICFPGLDQDQPWTFNDLTISLRGHLGWLAYALLVLGSAAALGYYLRCRRSHGPDVLDVADTDDDVLAAGAHDQATGRVDVGRLSLEPSAAAEGDHHLPAQRGAQPAVVLGEPASG